MIEQLLLTPTLSDKAKAYQFSELCKHARISTIPAVGAVIVLMLFEYQHNQTALIWFWFLAMLLIQLARYTTSTFSSLTERPIHRKIWIASVYIAPIWFLAYIYLFNSPTLAHQEVVFRSFFIYIIFAFHLEVVRYDLRLLVFESVLVTIALIVYSVFFTTLAQDLKLTYSLVILFGGINLIYFGRRNHLLVCEAYVLMDANESMMVKMNEMLAHDELTQQFNRRYFNAELNKYLSEYARSQERFCLAIVDIDFFKKVNDEYGHIVGDTALIALADFIRKRIKKTDVFARYGGEEFVLILPKTSLDTAEKIMDKIRLNCAKKVFMFENLALNLTISIGIAEVRDGDDETSILRRTDDALYAAKRGGRNCIKKAVA